MEEAIQGIVPSVFLNDFCPSFSIKSFYEILQKEDMPLGN